MFRDLSALFAGFFASIPDCRSCDSAITVHPECMPIPIPRGDHFYPQINETSGQRVCIAFMRSLPGQQHLGLYYKQSPSNVLQPAKITYPPKPGPREQINQNSAFIDAAHIYGEHECQGRELRSGYGGRMNVTRHPVHGKDLLPQSPVHPECKSPSGYCFIAGIVNLLNKADNKSRLNFCLKILNKKRNAIYKVSIANYQTTKLLIFYI